MQEHTSPSPMVGPSLRDSNDAVRLQPHMGAQALTIHADRSWAAHGAPLASPANSAARGTEGPFIMEREAEFSYVAILV